MLAQRRQQGEQWQAEDGEIIPLDARKKLPARAFQRVAADARQRRLALGGEVVFQECIAEIAQPQLRSFHMAPNRLAVFCQNSRAYELMILAAQPAQEHSRLIEVRRFADDLILKSQNLIGAQHQRIRLQRRNAKRLHLGQRFGHPRRLAVQRMFDRVLVNARRDNLERHAGILQKRRTDRACRGENEPRHALFSWRSVNRLSTAAAVSSTERRETSITGQLRLSNSLRVAVISARTLSRST